MKKKSGSAIIIAMLLISAVGGIAFSFSKIMFLEVANANSYENGALAYYAAESGIEEGFLRYRYNQNAEIPLSNSSGWTLGGKEVFRSNLTDKSVDIGGDSGIPITNALSFSSTNKQVYDLRMGYLGTAGLPYHAQNADGSSDGELTEEDYWNANYGTGDFSSLSVPKDESVKIDLTNLNLSDVNNKLEFDVRFTKPLGGNFDQGTNEGCFGLVEIKFVVKSGATINEYKDLLAPDTTLCSGKVRIDGNKLLPGYPSSVVYNGAMFQYKSSDLRQIFTRAGVGYPLVNSQVTLYIKPLYYNAVIGLHIAGCDLNPLGCTSRDKIVAGPYTAIESTGYFGNSSRKLVANIDRQSGTLYDLFDYVLYKKD